MKAPRLKGSKQVPLEHAPSGKIRRGGKEPSFSMSSVLWLSVFITSSFCSFVPARLTNTLPIISEIFPKPGTVLINALATNEISPSNAIAQTFGSKQDM